MSKEVPPTPNVGGIYTDPFHAPITASANLFSVQAPWFGGLRVLGRTDPSSDNFVCIGNDDGIHWWTLTGEFTNDPSASAVKMDFTPKAPGVGLLQCGYEESKGLLHFFEDDGATIGNTWSRLSPTDAVQLEPQQKHAAFNDVNGLYVDPEIYHNGSSSFAGIRVISDRLGKFINDEICVIGTDDGQEWWAVTGGKFTNRRAGEFTVGNLITQAKCTNGNMKLTMKDEGNNIRECVWTKMSTQFDFHSLPKQNDTS